jgi:hypothetical protein
MALDDRERNFEDALARHLQANRSAKASAGSPASAPHDNCADAEILAAYHERLLDAEEMILRKEHIASCPRCQQVLAQLEATEEIGLDDREECAPRSAAAMAQTPQVHAARTSATPLASASVAKPSAPMEMPRRRSHPRWLVPAGVLAAGLLVWIAIHDRIAPGTPFNLAKNQSQPAPELSPRTAPPPTHASEEKSSELGRQAPPPKPDAAGRDEYAAAENARKRKPASPSSVPATRGDLPSSDSVASERRAPNALRPLPQSPPDNKKQVARSVESPSSAPPGVSESVVVSAAAQPVPQEAKKEAAPNGVAAVPSLEQSQAVSGRAFREIVNLQALQPVRNPLSVSSPNGAVVWRLLPSGIIQRSADAGANWTVQKTATVADLLAGSAVSEKTCWMVGRGGTILLTTDGGNHWMKVSSPTTDDITTVFAVDAQQATITAAKNNSYKTTDGGITWTPLANP